MARKKRIRLPHVLLSLLFLLLLIGGAVFFAKTYTPPTKEQYLERSSRYLEGLQEELGVTGTFQETVYWDWIDKDGTLLPLTGKQFLLGTVDTNGIGKYGNVHSNNLTKINKKFFTPIAVTTTEYFTKSKFIPSEKNARSTMKDELNEVFGGFERNTIKCLFRLTPQSDPYGYFFCGIVDELQRTRQKQLSSLFSTRYNPKKYYSFRVDTIDPPYARGSYSEIIEGYVFIAKKTDDSWKLIWKGNEIASCNEMEKLDIPKSIYQDCYKDAP